MGVDIEFLARVDSNRRRSGSSRSSSHWNKVTGVGFCAGNNDRAVVRNFLNVGAVFGHARETSLLFIARGDAGSRLESEGYGLDRVGCAIAVRDKDFTAINQFAGDRIRGFTSDGDVGSAVFGKCRGLSRRIGTHDNLLLFLVIPEESLPKLSIILLNILGGTGNVFDGIGGSSHAAR